MNRLLQVCTINRSAHCELCYVYAMNNNSLLGDSILASIGQVYKARLVSNGDMTAIKIQRPRCEGTSVVSCVILDIHETNQWTFN